LFAQHRSAAVATMIRRPLILTSLLLIGCREATPPPQRVETRGDCRTRGRADAPETYSCAVTEALASKKLGSTIDALLQGEALASPRPPDATLLDLPRDNAVPRLLAATVPQDQRPNVELGLATFRNVSNEEAKLLLVQAGVRAQASLAAAVTHLFDTALRVGPKTTLSQEQLAGLLTVIDAELEPTFHTMKPEERSAAFDALLIEAGLIATTQRLDPQQARALATSCLQRFKLR
jgi:hypothetical protein